MQHVDIATSPSGWTVSGEIDGHAVPALKAAFAVIPDEVHGPIEVDLAAVTFIDSSGIRVLLELSEQMTAAGGSVVIRNPSKAVSKILEITGLATTFGLADTRSSTTSE